MQGLRWRFVDLRGQALVINFWASWCEPCRAEMPSLEKLASQYPGRLRVLTINFKESPRTVAAFKERLSLQLPVVIDADGVLAKTYGVRIFPSTVLIDSSGKVRSVVRGSLDWSGPQGRSLVGPLLTKQPQNA
ncbi:TlpA family protein disulfide reductase, partial [bacterium]|nr:TlpA family protein disulfide reductase [bacterium]